MEDTLVPIAVFFFVFGLPVFGFVIFRYLAHKERMEMIRHGILPAAGLPRDWRAAASQRAPRAGAADYGTENPQAALRKGISVAFVGFAILIGLSFIGVHEDSLGIVHFHPGPWLLGGLVPLFVGLAQVVIALLSGASFGPMRQAFPPHTENPYRAEPGPGAASGSVPTYDEPYAYRPGATQELKPPSAPPDRR